jgi:CHAT domain-containing protein/Tfp pilus assembly protein PilF
MGSVIHPFKTDFLCFVLFFNLLDVAPLYVFGADPGLKRQSVQLSSDDALALEPGRVIKRDLAGGQRHSYRIKLTADQSIKLTVEKDGIDVVVQVREADGKGTLNFDSDLSKHGEESVSMVADLTGDYRFIVQPKEETAAPGHYQIRIEELRPATENDRALFQAHKLHQECIRLYSNGKYDEASRSCEQALSTRERVLGPENIDVGSTLNLLGILSVSKGDYAKAETLYQRVLKILEKALGPEHLRVASILNNLASLYWSRGHYSRVEPLWLRALAIREKELGAEDTEVAYTLDNLSILYKDRGDYAKAEEFNERALAILEKNLGPDDPGIAGTIDNLAILNSVIGNYPKAELLHRRALVIQEKALGSNHPEIADYLGNLAILHMDKGDYANAESLYQRALSIKETLGSEHPDVAVALSNLGALYHRLGDYKKAEEYFRRALAIEKKVLGPRTPQVAESLFNLGLVCLERGELANAKSLFQQALEIQEKELSLEHPKVANTLNSLAIVFQNEKAYGRAEELYRRALAIREKALGPDHPAIANSLSSVASIRIAKGEYEKAEPLYRRALAILEKALGPGHPSVAKTLNDLAVLEFAKGDPAHAVMVQSRANEITEHSLVSNLAIGSERQKLAYLLSISEQLDRTLTLHIRQLPADQAARDMAAAIILQRKGRALDAASENFNALRNRFNNEDQGLLDRLIDTRSQIARLVIGGPQNMVYEQYRDRIKTLEDRAENLEAGIGRRSGEFRARSRPITLAAVQEAIPEDAVLIEFAAYRPFDAKGRQEMYGAPRYVAYLIRHQGEIQWKELGDVKFVDRTIDSLREALRKRKPDVKRQARAVDLRVFQPLRPLIGDTTKILISPDGLLNLIPFAALMDERGRYLVERYSISYLASGRDLLRLQVPRESQTGPLVVAAPDFGKRIEILAERKIEGLTEKVSAASIFNRLFFSPLPYTAEEGAAVSKLLPGATLLSKRQASKSALSGMRSPALLHIATHGFFLKDLNLAAQAPGMRGPLAASEDPERLVRQLEKSGSSIENPLLRSGLALAGANEQNQNDNGILTALEVTGLNLWGTKLVVLSACDTGVGDVKTGDGVHGLRRALMIAGAETQVLSLWPVSDVGARDFMISYYRLLQQGEGRGEALRKVQLQMLKNVHQRHPYYWANFIQSGEWAKLEKREAKPDSPQRAQEKTQKSQTPQ